MFDIFYENNQKERISFVEWPYMITGGNLFDGKYDEIEKDGRILGFKREITDKKLNIDINAVDLDFQEAVNKLAEVTERDIVDQIPGRLYVGNSYMKCWIVGTEKDRWVNGVGGISNELTIRSDYPFWITETEYAFKVQNITSSSNKKYPLKYPFRYANGMDNAYVINPNFTDSNFILRVYGPVVNPQVNIGGHAYIVNTILEIGEYLEINSMNGTVVKTMMNGMKVNIFHARAKGAKSVFKKISAGRQEITWPGTFNFDLIVYEERSEPKWNG